MASDPRQRLARYRRGAQKSNRRRGTAACRRSVENQNRPAQPRRAWLNQLTRRLRLARPRSLPPDRIDQIAAATAVACTDRSTSRWKQNKRAKRKRKRSRENLQPLDQQTL